VASVIEEGPVPKSGESLNALIALGHSNCNLVAKEMSEIIVFTGFKFASKLATLIVCPLLVASICFSKINSFLYVSKSSVVLMLLFLIFF